MHEEKKAVNQRRKLKKIAYIKVFMFLSNVHLNKYAIIHI